MQYGLAHSPQLDREAQWQRCEEHLRQKYGHGGYLRLWLEESPNAGPLARLRQLIADTERLHSMFEKIYDEETANK